MKIVNKKFRGKALQVIYDVPCESCSRWSACKQEKTYCSAFTLYVNYGWFDITKIKKRLKKL